jgi:serine/threonine-protein kinase
MVAKGSTVTLYISSGPNQVPVPSVVGQSLAQAQATLTAAGFKVSASSQPTLDPTKDGVVISQDPASGKAAKGSTVAIVVGKFTTGTTATSLPH